MRLNCEARVYCYYTNLYEYKPHLLAVVYTWYLHAYNNYVCTDHWIGRVGVYIIEVERTHAGAAISINR